MMLWGYAYSTMWAFARVSTAGSCPEHIHSHLQLTIRAPLQYHQHHSENNADEVITFSRNKKKA